MWIEELKISIIEKDIDKLDELINRVPNLTKQDEIDEAICLISEAKNVVVSLKNDTQKSMIQIKKSIDFLRATEVLTTNRLDIVS